MKSPLLLVVALTFLGVSVTAQSHPGKFLRCNRPLRSASLDLATGMVTRGPAARDRSGTTIADFTNLDVSSFVGVDTGGGACEWIDAGTKGFAGNASELITEIAIAYCSTVADQNSGGVGSAVMLGFYEGYTVGGPAPTTAVALMNLTGLPGHTADTSYIAVILGSSGQSCYVLEIDLGACISFADGPIGYSWRFMDLGTSSIEAGTYPFLSCVQSCSGMGPDGQGMIDSVDKYCPPGSQPSTFSFGTTPWGSYFTSIAMDIREAADAEAVATSWNGEGINSDVLSAGAIVLGSGWENAITLGHAHGGSGPTNIKVRTSCVNGPNLTSPTGHPFELLTAGPLSLLRTDSHNGTVADYEPDFPVPHDLSLVGLPWAAQGTVVGGGRADLTTARCGVVGSIDAIADP